MAAVASMAAVVRAVLGAVVAGALPRASSAAVTFATAAAKDGSHRRAAVADVAFCHAAAPPSRGVAPPTLALVQLTAGPLRKNATREARLHVPFVSLSKWTRKAELEDEASSAAPSRNMTAAEMTGVQMNKAGDLQAFLSALGLNCTMICVSFVVVSKLRKTFRSIYCYNVMNGRVTKDMYNEETFERFFGWWTCSWALRMDDVARVAGLDQCQLLEFANMSMQLLGMIGLPLILVLGPLHWLVGGNRSGDDYLSKWGMANVVDKHPYLYYVHAIVVWGVVVATQRQVFLYMQAFLTRRKLWLMMMPAPRSTTVLVEGIPPEDCSDEHLKAFFDSVFAREVVAEATVVKKTGRLLALMRRVEAAEVKLEEAEFQLARGGTRPVVQRIVGRSVDAIDFYTGQRDQARRDVEGERRRILDASPDPGGVNSTNGFVTFKTRRDAEVALKMTYTSDEDEYAVSLPPDPSDVIYTDFQRSPDTQKLRETVGYAAIFGIFWAYMPCVIAISAATSLEDLGASYPRIFQRLSEDPATVAMWDGMVASLVLQLFVSLVPTILVLVFLCFFVLKADAWLQHCVQTWYFYFLIVFVLLVTCVGNSLLVTIDRVVEHPTVVFALPARAMPSATHFYLNYLCLQCVTHAQSLLRTAQLGKFLALRAILEEDRAKELAEPEDQDYNGIGSRSARFAFLLVLVLVFCTLSPLITGLGYINFFIIRTVYGYLLVFAETKKPDLGGVFWYTQLKHVQQGLLVYIILMTGVLLERAATVYPSMLACTSMLFLKATYDRFDRSFDWQQMSMEDLSREDDGKMQHEKGCPTRATYVQPELVVS